MFVPETSATLEMIGANEVELRDNYDAVFHLVTVAKGAEAFYVTANNSARTETVEVERRLSKDEYLILLMDADTGKRQIRKTRYCLTYKNQYFEIDVYPFWNDRAIAEIELSDENAEIKFPKEIKVIKEVTDDVSYRNASLASID